MTTGIHPATLTGILDRDFLRSATAAGVDAASDLSDGASESGADHR